MKPIEIEQIVNSDGPIRVYASCEYDELGSNGKVWIGAVVKAAYARGIEDAAKAVEDGTMDSEMRSYSQYFAAVIRALKEQADG